MKKYSIGLFAMVAMLVLCSQAEAQLFGRFRGTCANGSCTPAAKAQPTVVYQQSQRTVTRTHTYATTSETATAQGVANIMARLGRIGHFGGHRWFEGVGCASTPQGAYNICCYSNSGMVTYDYGIARGRNGMYYACRRYRP